MKEAILKEYDDQSKTYENYGKRVLEILNEILNTNLAIHDKVFRLKDRPKLAEKIDRKGSGYNKLSDITDIAGARIITYLESDVDRVGDIIKANFNLDLPNCVDKRELEFDRFGYRSLHYVVSLNEERTRHAGNSAFKGLKVEIQIRSILQHAWAELEHDLGYKSEIAIPDKLKRSFTRLAALLETADIEFVRLKNQIANYTLEVTDSILEKPESVEINRDSLRSFLSANPTLVEIATLMRSRGISLISINNDLSIIIVKLRFFEIENIHELQNSILTNESHFLRFSKALVTTLSTAGAIVAYAPLLYFLHFLGSSKDQEYFERYANYGSAKQRFKLQSRSKYVDLFKATSLSKR